MTKHAPLKSKVISENNKSLVAKALIKAIILRSALKKKAYNLNDPLTMKLNNLSRKAKKDSSQKHTPHDSSSKNLCDIIMLVENEKEVSSKNEEIAYIFNTYSNDITK